MEATAAGLFGDIHGLVGAVQRRRGAVVVGADQRDADARTDLDLQLIADVERLAHFVDDGLRDLLDLRDVVDADQHDRELVAAGSGDKIGASYDPFENVRDSAQNDVTRSEEHTSELQSLIRSSYAVVRLKQNNDITEDT